MLEVAELRDFWRELGEKSGTSRPLHRQHCVVVTDVLDLDVEVADEVAEMGQVGLSRSEEELIGAKAQDHPVLVDEAAVVAPDRVLGVSDRACPDVAREHAAEIPLGVGPCESVLVQR